MEPAVTEGVSSGNAIEEEVDDRTLVLRKPFKMGRLVEVAVGLVEEVSV